jgi:hypothetical protein
VLLHSGEKTPSSPNFTHDTLFTTTPVPSYVLPGYEEPMGRRGGGCGRGREVL